MKVRLCTQYQCGVFAKPPHPEYSDGLMVEGGQPGEALDEHGVRRYSNPRDFVRNETCSTLSILAMRTSCFAATALLLFALTARAQAVRKPAHILHAVRTEEKIVIDGALNDDAWKQVPITLDFTQRDPI